ncbi:MAG TPA: hypothetical protein VFU06_14440 [Longimicrobiales bacterium]|nr:hypothetical protein [Longimicrobiales bacterium]
MRVALLTALIAAAACDVTPSSGRPMRLVVGSSDTVIINSMRPVQLSARVFDSAGSLLPGDGVRYQWLSGAPLPLSATGVATCAQAGDAIVRASLGALVARVAVRCRPVHEVRSMRMVNLLVGGPSQEIPFEAADSAGRPVTLLAGYVTVRDSGIATVQGSRITGRTPGTTSLDMRIGDRTAHASVHAYALVETVDSIRAGQHLAVPVRLSPGEAREWRLPAAGEPYFVTVIADADDQPKLRIYVVGADCSPGLDGNSYFCTARQQTRVGISYPTQPRSGEQVSGALAVWRRDRPSRSSRSGHGATRTG